MLKIKEKKAIIESTIVWIIIGVIILTVLVVASVILAKKGVSLLEFIKNLFRFGS